MQRFLPCPEQVVQQSVTTAQSLMVSGLDIGKQVTDSISSLRNTLQNDRAAVAEGGASRRNQHTQFAMQIAHWEPEISFAPQSLALLQYRIRRRP
jgi:hypothetical protein